MTAFSSQTVFLTKKCVYVVLSLHVECSHLILYLLSYVVVLLIFFLSLTLIVLFLNFWLRFYLRLSKSIYFSMLLPWELQRQQINKMNKLKNISTLSSTELENILNVAKNILRNVLVWTCINLWIMIMLNDKSYMISQRFYCCGSKVVLNRLLCDLCGPRLMQPCCRNNVLYGESFHLDLNHCEKMRLWDFKERYILQLLPGSSGSQKILSHCAIFFLFFFFDFVSRGPFQRTVPDEMTQ